MRTKQLIRISVFFAAAITCGSFAQAAVTNVALGKPAVQSSVYPGNGGAGLAVDGNIDGNYYLGGSVATTNNDSPQELWRVDLGNAFFIGDVVLWNRTDGFGDRLSNFRVSVLDSSMSEVAGMDFFTGAGEFAPRTTDWATPANTQGRFVQVQLLGQNWLQLAEVQALGSPVPEPQAYVMLLAGVGLIGIMVRRRCA